MASALPYIENDQIHMPEERTAITHKFSVGGEKGYVTVGLYDDGRPGEIRIVMGGHGSTISGLMGVISKSVSLGLQYGVPMHVFVDKFSHVRFDPQGFTGNQDIPVAKSVVDYVFRWLGAKFCQ
jgi:ribonucleoside-diphosphate reductase alpha chain